MKEKKGRGTRIEKSKEPGESPRPLTQDYLKERALAQLSPLLPEVSPIKGTPRDEWITSFVERRVTGVRVNGVDIISIDIGDHRSDPLPSVARAYLQSDRTKIFVADYFEPELRDNGVYRLLTPGKSLKNYGRSMVGKETIDYPWHEYMGQLGTAKRIEEVARELGKPVAVADIANKSSYIAAENMLQLSPALLGVPFGLPGFIASSVGALVWRAYLQSQLSSKEGKKGTGIADKEKVTKLDKFIIDFTQARRLYLAKAIEMLTQEYQPQEGEETPQIVVLYPRAHTLRMEDILLDPQPGFNTVRGAIYKSFPWLNFSVRKWEYRQAGVDEKGREQKARWVRTSRERIGG